MDPVAFLMSLPGFGPFVPYVLALGFVCAGLATVLPAPGPASGVVYVLFYRSVNWAGMNFGHARNAGAPPSGAGALAAVSLGAAAVVLTACAGQTADQRAATSAAITGGLACVVHATGEISAIAATDAPNIAKATASGAVLLTDPNCKAALAAGLAAVPSR